MATTKKNDQSDFNFNFHRNNGRIIVSNSLSYTMAEYDENTGLTRWHRVVPAAQREKIQVWLLAQYPVKVEPPEITTKSKARALAA
jgi:hypothetical protein